MSNIKYITDEEFVAAQDSYNNEPDETKANDILKDIFWPYLNNLAFCTIKKILTRNGVINHYSTEDIDMLTKDVVCKLIGRYVNSKKGVSRFYKKYHMPYRKDLPKAMVWNAVIGTLYKKPIKEVSLDCIGEIAVESWEDAIIEKVDAELNNELYNR